MSWIIEGRRFHDKEIIGFLFLFILAYFTEGLCF